MLRMITDTILMRKPVFIISVIFILLVPNIMALGGVATGSIKAKDAAKVAGSINKSGLTLILTAKPASMGKSISVVAVLEVRLVSSDINIEIEKTTIKGE